MELPTYLLCLLGFLGAVDILCFHSVAHGIRSHQDSVKELVCHSLRGPTYAILFVLMPNFALHGLFAWGLLALFLIDVAISVWDFWLEQDSRRFLGGLPSGEYVLHMLMAMVFGGMVATFVYTARLWFESPSRLIYEPQGAPLSLRVTLLFMAVLVFISGIQDALAAFKLRKQAQLRKRI